MTHADTANSDEFPQWVRDAIAAHHEQYRRDPIAAHRWDPIVIGVPGGPVPCLVLYHTGRKSGRILDSILQYYCMDGEVAIVASKGGVPDNPAWYYNLKVEPRCAVRVGAFYSEAVAHEVEGETRKRWWDFITREQPQQLQYQARTRRTIPVLVLAMATPFDTALIAPKP